MEDKLEYEAPTLMELVKLPLVQGGTSTVEEFNEDEDGNENGNSESDF